MTLSPQAVPSLSEWPDEGRWRTRSRCVRRRAAGASKLFMISRSSRSGAVAYSLCMTVRLSAAVALAVALLTSACSQSEPAGAPAPPPIASAAPSSLAPTSGTSGSAAPSTAAPTPATATPYITSADEAGAIAFVREYFRRLDDASARGYTAGLAVMRTPSCPCKAFETEVASVVASGSSYRSSPTTVHTIVQGPSGPAFSRMAAEFSAAPLQVVKTGQVLSTEPATRGVFYFDLVLVSGHWLASEIRGDVRHS